MKRWTLLLMVVAVAVSACGDGGEGAGTTVPTVPDTTEAPSETTAAPTETTEAPTDTTEAPTDTTETTETTDTTAVVPEVVSECPEDAELTLKAWTDEARAPVMVEIAPAFTAETGVCVEVEILAFDQIRDQVAVAGPAGEGPDIFIGAHDWVGQLAADGAADPIDLGSKASDFVEVALSAFSYEGSLYAVPYATEAVALYYNTDLVPDAPTTWDELVAACEALPDIENCLGMPGGVDPADAYHHYPFISAQGGFIFEYSPETGFDVSNVGLDTEGAIAGAQFLADQVAAGIIAPLDYGTASQLFLDGSQPFWMTGPWEVGNLNAQTTVNWSVAKIPTMNGNTPGPFVGAQGVFLSSFSENKLVAQSFMLDYLATQEGMQALYDADPRNPAYQPVLDGLAGDEVVETFAASAADGVPMPNVPEMGSVWVPLGENLLLIRNGDITPEEAMTSAAEAVRAALEG